MQESQTMAKRSDMTDEEFGKRLVSVYDQVAALHADGARDDGAEHPMKTINAWIAECRAAAAGAPVGAEVEGTDSEADVMPTNPNGKDSPPDFPGKPANPKGAADSALAEHRILTSGGADIPGQLAAHRARQTDPARVANMSAHLQGYGRLK